MIKKNKEHTRLEKGDCMMKNLVEVVRCKDCIYTKKVKKVGNGITEPPYVTVWRCDISELGMKENDYCSYGKRKISNDVIE